MVSGMKFSSLMLRDSDLGIIDGLPVQVHYWTSEARVHAGTCTGSAVATMGVGRWGGGSTGGTDPDGEVNTVDCFATVLIKGKP